MDTRTALLTRRTIHDFTTAPLPEGAVERALEAAIRAPNHKLTNPWRFTRVGAATRPLIVEIGLEEKRKKRGELSDAAQATLRKKFGNPPELIVVSQVLDADPHRRREDYAAIACAIQNLHLSLWSEGIGSKWASGAMTHAPDTYKAVGIDPQVEEIVGFVWVGYAEVIPDTPRRPLAEVVRTTE
ncbi:nitroreductase [Lujinxingia litoralis]|uniref:Nitroreductase n=1 Tax=Lujinxingia litoralis TaxID=2211119 RepID=A0A328C618_9DELT|nr:nitroreductase [Lujinxingia litoralis]RAL22949.1 nitroreductase [Lujinxingia litoralis]